jgi:hypothetical protein
MEHPDTDSPAGPGDARSIAEIEITSDMRETGARTLLKHYGGVDLTYPA